MSLSWLIAASAAYAVGGLFMKLSDGATWPRATLAFIVLFLLGALAQARGMRTTDLSTSYILVLGLEALGAVALGTLVLHESFGPSRVAAVLLVVSGITWLRLL